LTDDQTVATYLNFILDQADRKYFKFFLLLLIPSVGIIFTADVGGFSDLSAMPEIDG